MIKKLFDICIEWAGRKYATSALAFVSFIESSFFPIPPDVMIIPMVIARKQSFLKIAIVKSGAKMKIREKGVQVMLQHCYLKSFPIKILI